MTFEETKDMLKSRADNKDNIGNCDSVCWKCSKADCTEYDKALNSVITIAATALTSLGFA